MKFSTFNSTWNLFLDIAVEAAEAQDNFVGFFDDPKAFRGEYCRGSGSYGSVYDCINPDHVFKTGQRVKDDGWIYYALDCIAKGDERPSWMPNIKKLYVDVKQSEFFAVIEELDELGSYQSPWIQDRFWDMDSIQNQLSDTDRLDDDTKQGIKEYLNIFGHEFGQDRDRVKFDAHSENWMVRRSDAKTVLTDPFSFNIPWKWTERYLRACARRFPNQVKFIPE